MDTTTQQQFIAGAPVIAKGIEGCGVIKQLDAQFNLDDVHGEIDIRQSGFDLYTIEVDSSTEQQGNYAIAFGVPGFDVVDTLMSLLSRTVPDSVDALKAASCSGQSYAWSVIRDVAIERLSDEERERMEQKYGGREDVSF